jgi:hypothetical protein
MEHVCTSCGAPARPGIIVCEFCERPVSAEAAKNAITCRQCRTLNGETAQQCMKCKGWLVVQCVFCNQLSRHDASACASCREPFAGAAERKAAHDADRQRQQIFQTAGAVAPIAGSLIGGLAGAFLGNSFGHSSSGSHGHETHGWSSGASHTSHTRNDYTEQPNEGSSRMREMFSSDDEAPSRGERGSSGERGERGYSDDTTDNAERGDR